MEKPCSSCKQDPRFSGVICALTHCSVKKPCKSCRTTGICVSKVFHSSAFVRNYLISAGVGPMGNLALLAHARKSAYDVVILDHDEKNLTAHLYITHRYPNTAVPSDTLLVALAPLAEGARNVTAHTLDTSRKTTQRNGIFHVGITQDVVHYEQPV